ncbi:hypothetical protein B7463_g9558, partial [Scytalidium lignicola]
MGVKLKKYLLYIALVLPAVAGAIAVWHTTSQRYESGIILQRVNKYRALIQAVIQLPSALWTGAITPNTTPVDVNATFQVPNYDKTTSGYWAKNCAPAVPCDYLLGNISALGTFTYVAWKTKTGLLLNSVDQASSRNSSLPRYKKLDNTGFTYTGRSYGVASTIGLLDPTPKITGTHLTILNISFIENGYQSEVSCIYNQSSRLVFNELGYFNTPGGLYAPTGFWPNGSLPNGDWPGFPTWGVLNSDFVTALAAVKSQDQYMYGFMAGKYYNGLNATQCVVTFTPTRFQVSVDMTAKNISVVPVGIISNPADDIDSSRALVNISFYGPSYLSQTLTTMYSSVLGDSFLNNIGKVQAREGDTDSASSNLTVIEEGLELLIDQFLGSSGAAQVMLLHDTKPVDCTITVQAEQFGSRGFASSSLAVSIIVISVAVVQACKRNLWRDLPVFDCLDLKSATIGSAKGSAKGNQSLPGAVRNWKGNADGHSVGAICLTVAKGEAEFQFCEDSLNEVSKREHSKGVADEEHTTLLADLVTNALTNVEGNRESHK